VDLKAEGPWQPAQEIPFSSIPSTSSISSAVSNSETQAESRPAALPPAADESPRADTDSLSGTVTFHNANWKADYLASHVEISQATLYLDNGEIRWDPVVFSYGPVKGTATLTLPAVCDPPQPCPPHFQVQFGDLDASALQVAILGAHEPGTLLSSLIARLTTSTTPAWPQLEGTVKADSLILGPVTLREASATLRILPTGAEITSLDAGLLGGRVHGSGALHAAGTDQGKPSYTLEGQFEKLSPAAVGQLLGLRWSGGVLDADGKIDLSGFTGKDLTGSAKGTLHFEWRHGAVEAQGVAQRSGKDNVPATASVPPALARFDRWTGDTEIANGAMTLKQNEVWQGSRERAVEVTLTFGAPPKVAFAMPRETQAKK
jgi:hypothetical protein